MLPPTVEKRRAAVRFGQVTTEARKKEQYSTLAVAVALAAGGYLVLRYAERF